MLIKVPNRSKMIQVMSRFVIGLFISIFVGEGMTSNLLDISAAIDGQKPISQAPLSSHESFKNQYIQMQPEDDMGWPDINQNYSNPSRCQLPTTHLTSSRCSLLGLRASLYQAEVPTMACCRSPESPLRLVSIPTEKDDQVEGWIQIYTGFTMIYTPDVPDV